MGGGSDQGSSVEVSRVNSQRIIVRYLCCMIVFLLSEVIQDLSNKSTTGTPHPELYYRIDTQLH